VTRTGRDDRRLTRDPRLWRVIIAASLGVFAIELDFFAVQAALPDMANDLHTSVTNLQGSRPRSGSR
jgi:predicted MFS family arabinose efflux permease